MDSSAPAARGRGRASARKRNTIVSTGAPLQPSSATTTSNTAEPAEQASTSVTADAISTSPISPGTTITGTRGTRTRARAAEGLISSPIEPDNKGGHSLRKRARVDYTLDQFDENGSDGGKAAPPNTRGMKRRRTDSALHDNQNDEDYGGALIKRRSSEQLQQSLSASRRRSQAQRPVFNPFPVVFDQEVEVQDTIEVGGHRSEHSDETTAKQNSSYGSSSNGSTQLPASNTFDSTQTPTPQKHRQSPIPMNLNDTTENVAKQPEAGQSRPEADQPSQPAVSADPTEEEEEEEDIVPGPYDHLTPYIDGAFIKWPYTELEAEAGPGSQSAQQNGVKEASNDQLDGIAELDVAPEDSLVPDLLGPIDTTPGGDAMEGDTPAMSPIPVDTMANSPTADAELPDIAPRPKRPIVFKKTRDASEFVALFEDYKSLPAEDLLERLEVANRALVSWQAEYNELRKITDDERNATRYRNWVETVENRPKRKIDLKKEDKHEFVVQGIRATRPDAAVQYARDQDRLMAAVYQFEYDENPSKIGFQDPLAQKPDGKGRLRERPKQTAKAAEADDSVIIQGKRIRKPPVLFDGSEAVSNRSSPVPPQRRRRRGAGNTAAAEDKTDVQPAVQPAAQAVENSHTPAEPVPPKKKGKGGRPRKYPLPVPVPAPAPEPTPAPAEGVQEKQPEQVEEEGPARKRRRTTKAAATAITAAPAKAEAPIIEEPAPKMKQEEPEEAPATEEVAKPALVNTGLRRGGNRFSEVPAGSFYNSSTMPPAPAVDESRPQTSSSTTTQGTVGSSNYQLREKRQKVFTLETNEEGNDEPPKPKRGRRPKKAKVEEVATAAAPSGPTSSTQAQQKAGTSSSFDAAPGAKPTPKIKLKNYTAATTAPAAPTASALSQNPFSVPSSTNSTPSLVSNGTTSSSAATGSVDPADTKEYKQMTKSEKMSQSMKARWASGSMSQAVAKRRVTLANKKQVVKAAEASQPPEAPPVVTKS